MSNLKDFLGGLDPAVWTDAKAAYLDDNISTKAPASTALSTATWTNTRAGNLDNVDATISSRAPSSTALSTSTWTNTKAGYLDASISSRAPSSTALSSNVWTTTYRDRIDTTISSRLSTCSTQHLASNDRIGSSNNYKTWTVSSVNTAQSFLTSCSPSGWGQGAYVGYNARIVNSTNVRYLYAYTSSGSYYGVGWNLGNNGYGVVLDLVRIY